MLVRLTLAAVLVTGIALAQGGRGGGGRVEGGGPPMMGMRMPQSPQDILFDKLKLSGDQKEQATKIVAEAMEKAAPSRDAINRGRTVIANHLTGKGSPEDLKKILTEFSMVEATMIGIEADAFGKIVALLKPNQQSKAAQAFPLMVGMFDGSLPDGGGRGPGGPGRGRGGR